MITSRRRHPRLIVTLLAFAAASGLLAACSTVETNSFVVRDAANIASAQIAVGADFSKYDRLQAEDMGIFFPAGVDMAAEDLQRLRSIFREAFVAELEGYSISRQSGPTTMAVQASLIDLRGPGSAGSAVTSLRRDIRDLAAPGSLVFLMELKDSETGRVLGRAADSARAPALGTSGDSETDWQAVEEAAGHWARLFRGFLDANLSPGQQ